MLTKLLTLDALKGRRTQIAAVATALLTLALNLGWIDQKTYLAILGFLTSVGLVTASVHQPAKP